MTSGSRPGDSKQGGPTRRLPLVLRITALQADTHQIKSRCIESQASGIHHMRSSRSILGWQSLRKHGYGWRDDHIVLLKSRVVCVSEFPDEVGCFSQELSKSQSCKPKRFGLLGITHRGRHLAPTVFTVDQGIDS